MCIRDRECSDPISEDGSSCDDENHCSLNDTCLAGLCTPGESKACDPPETCRESGICIPATGSCVYPTVADYTFCDDGDACTLTDQCQAGDCIGSDPKTCIAPNDCSDAGTCQPDTGECTSIPKPDGTICHDGSDCTDPDNCSGGLCVGTPVVSCPPAGQCQILSLIHI